MRVLLPTGRGSAWNGVACDTLRRVSRMIADKLSRAGASRYLRQVIRKGFSNAFAHFADSSLADILHDWSPNCRDYLLDLADYIDRLASRDDLGRVRAEPVLDGPENRARAAAALILIGSVHIC